MNMNVILLLLIILLVLGLFVFLTKVNRIYQERYKQAKLENRKWKLLENKLNGDER